MNNLEANFSVLIMSIASSAAVSLGIAPEPSTGQYQKDKNLARFNIDLLLILQEKTKNNLSPDETKLLTNILNDLQLKYVETK